MSGNNGKGRGVKKTAKQQALNTEVAVFELVGDLDRGALAAIADLCGEAAKGPVRSVVLDLSRVEHLDYAGISHLVQRRKRLRARGIDLILVSSSKYLHQIVRIGGGADMEIARSLQEALDTVVCAQVAAPAPGRARKTG